MSLMFLKSSFLGKKKKGDQATETIYGIYIKYVQFLYQLHLKKLKKELIEPSQPKIGNPPHVGLHIYITECNILSYIKDNGNSTK